MRGAVPDCVGQTQNAGQPDHLDRSKNVQAGNAGNSAGGQLRRHEPGTRGENLSGEQLVIRSARPGMKRESC